MDYKSENKYKVFFKDGTSFDSNGSADGIKKSSIAKEFEWTAFHIEKEVRLAGKTLADILRVEYNLKYEDVNNF